MRHTRARARLQGLRLARGLLFPASTSKKLFEEGNAVRVAYTAPARIGEEQEVRRKHPLKSYLHIVRHIAEYEGEPRALLFGPLISGISQLPDVSEMQATNMRGGRAVDSRLEKLAFSRLEVAAQQLRVRPHTPSAPSAPIVAAAVVGATRGAQQRSPQQVDHEGAAAGAPVARQDLESLAGASRRITPQIVDEAPLAPADGAAAAPTRRSTRRGPKRTHEGV